MSPWGGSSPGGLGEATWDDALLNQVADPSGLVSLARARRLLLEGPHGPHRIELCRIDEITLALIELAQRRNKGITIAYPAPAGQVAVLVAAQLLLRQF